ncbi:hypothetical protein ACR776_01570 [Sphingobacterium spiritivorum]|uniref:hypothetical protein n=1 Tax=Sphingobacterium spiritivorum TaxID=258 RepID=UPI003DA2AFAA
MSSRFDKIVYLRYMPLTSKIFTDFYMDSFSEGSNIKVEYWDLSDIFFPNAFSEKVFSPEQLFIKEFESYHALEKELELNIDVKRTLFVSLMSFEGRIRKLLRILTRFNCTMSVFARNMFPVGYQLKSSFLSRLKSLNYSSLINRLESVLLNYDLKRGIVKGYDIIFQGGREGWKGIGRINYDFIKNSTVIRVNSDDYDSYLNNLQCEPVIAPDYILFLDEYLPLHPDTILFKIKNIPEEIYYKELNSFFNFVEQKTGLPIIIAAHPKAEKYKTKNFFEDRKVLFNKTVSLTKFAKYVIAHDSTSINFAISFRKPILFLSSENINKYISTVHNNVINFAAYLNLPHFLMENLEINLVDDISELRYESYKYDFQTSPETENTLSQEIFKNFILNKDNHS